MGFELKRREGKFLPVQMNGEILKAQLDDSLARYKNYMHCNNQMKLIASKAAGLNKDSSNAAWDDFYTLYGTCVIALLRIVFSQADVDKILAFFENDAEEAVNQLMPFLSGEYLEALKAERKAASERKIKEI